MGCGSVPFCSQDLGIGKNPLPAVGHGRFLGYSNELIDDPTGLGDRGVLHGIAPWNLDSTVAIELPGSETDDSALDDLAVETDDEQIENSHGALRFSDTGSLGMLVHISTSGLLGFSLELGFEPIAIESVFPFGERVSRVTFSPGVTSFFETLAVNFYELDHTSMIFGGGLQFKTDFQFPQLDVEKHQVLTLLVNTGFAGCYFQERKSLEPCARLGVGVQYGSNLAGIRVGFDHIISYSPDNGVRSVYPIIFYVGTVLRFGS